MTVSAAAAAAAADAGDVEGKFAKQLYGSRVIGQMSDDFFYMDGRSVGYRVTHHSLPIRLIQAQARIPGSHK